MDIPSRASDPSAPKQPLLQALCSQAQSSIDRACGLMSNIDESVNRLLNPRPTQVPTAPHNAQQEPPAQTVETELNSILHRLDALCTRAEDIAHRLQSAV